MKELINELNYAFNMISSIAVAGEAVDYMASARAKLVKVIAGLEKMTATEKEGNAENE